MWRLAIKAMLGDRSKLLTSLLGVAFAVTLINLQGALFIGLMQKASMLVDHGQADIWVGHKHMSNVDVGTYVPERWISRIRRIDGVEQAQPYLVMFTQAKMPDGQHEVVMVVGCEPASLLGNAWAVVAGQPEDIRRPDAILIDESDIDRLGTCAIGDVREINGRRARIVGMTRGIVGFSTNPYVFTTLERARVYLGAPPGYCSFFLVKARPGSDLRDLTARIQAAVPGLEVYPRDTYSRKCVHYWLTRTGIGISFGLATFLGVLVGLAVVAQTLFAAVTERVKEFATLKALGADDWSVARFILVQAVGNAGLGGVLGLATAVLVGLAADTPRAPVVLTWWVALGSLLIITAICLLAAVLPCWQLRRIDPASVLRS